MKKGLWLGLWLGLVASAQAQFVGNGPVSLTAPLSTTPVTHEFVTGYPTLGGALSLAQPSTADLTTSLNALLAGNGSAVGSYAGTSCTNQAVTALSAAGGATCTSLTNAYLASGTFGNVTGTGTLTAGATGSGFTMNFTSSTLSGIIPGANGGTGVANTSKTLTLGANLATTGFGATTLAFPAVTSTFTFPVLSGGDTLAGLGSQNVFTVPQFINGLGGYTSGTEIHVSG
jgi:trimeric autotransporter adhesin